jgi:hypothetical protein
MLMGGPGPDGSDPHFRTQGAIFYEVRSVGQKSNGMLEQLFVRPTMAVLAAADGSLYAHPGAGLETSPSGKASLVEEGLPSNERWRAAAKPMAPVPAARRRMLHAQEDHLCRVCVQANGRGRL